MVNPDPVVDPMLGKILDEERVSTNRPLYFVKALVRNIRAGIQQTIEEVFVPESTKIAKAKKRKRIFSQPLDSDLNVPNDNTEED
jgi:hypothetical protein